MSNAYRRVELLANVAIIVVAVMLCTVLVGKFLLPTSAAGAPMKYAGVAAGDKVSIPNVDWAKSQKTLLLVLQKGCHFCTESAEFYRSIARVRAEKGVRVLAVLPQPVNEARDYLAKLSVDVDEVRQGTLDSVNVAGTPTLIFLDDNGVVRDVWVGKLSAEKESEVLSRL